MSLVLICLESLCEKKNMSQLQILSILSAEAS